MMIDDVIALYTNYHNYVQTAFRIDSCFIESYCLRWAHVPFIARNK